MAEEAWILISWAFEKYRENCVNEGNQVSSDLAMEKDIVCAVLVRKAKGLDIPYGAWPVKVLNKWECEKPFHAALGSRNLKSDWDSLREIIELQYGTIKDENV